MLFRSKIASRPTLSVRLSKTEILADGDDAAMLSGLPQPCQIEINGAFYDVPDGEISIVTRTPMDYHIRFDHLPYAVWTATVRAVTP